MLSYLCEKKLEGRASEITEYSIAHEALGRSAQFDPQQDAVVRVDTHHLRKRLKEYYAGPGAGNALRIVIPNGQYAPRFEFPEAPPPADGLAPAEIALPAPSPAKWRPNRKFWLAAASLLIVLGVAGWNLRSTAARLHTKSARSSPVPGIAANDEGIRIAVGAESPYTDSAGRTWMADRYFSGGAAFHRPTAPIQRTHDPELFQNGREGQFLYAIPVPPGIYELHLYFAETAVASDTLRSTNVGINGQLPANYDIASDAGAPNTATEKLFTDVRPGSDGLLRLTFQGGPNFLNAIEILPGIPGKLRPIRITSADAPFRDHAGQLWLPDQWAAGGRKSTRVVPIEGTADAKLYQWERVGHFSYSIPVKEGAKYTVTLHFSETWFTPPNALGGVGSRVFDVYCNGSTLLRNFDILKDAGARSNRAVVQVFRHVPSSPLGKIDLTFVPVVNYALINAIEITEE